MLLVVVSISKPTPKQNGSLSSLLENPKTSPLKLQVIKFETKAAHMGLTGIIAAQFLISHGNLLNKLQELQHSYENIKIFYTPTSPSPMKSLVNNKFHDISTVVHRKILPRRSTYNKSAKLQQKRPKSVWEFMRLRG